MTRQSVADPAATSLLVNKLIPYSPYQIVKYVAENMDDVKAAATNVNFINLTAAQVRADRDIVVSARDQIVPIQSQILALMDDVTIDAEKASQARDQAEDYAYMLGTTSLGYYYTSLAEGAAASAEGEAYFVIDAESRAYWGVVQDGIGVKTAELITVAIGGASVLEAKGYRDQAAASATLAASLNAQTTELLEDVDSQLGDMASNTKLASHTEGEGASQIGLENGGNLQDYINASGIPLAAFGAYGTTSLVDVIDETTQIQNAIAFSRAHGIAIKFPYCDPNTPRYFHVQGLTFGSGLEIIGGNCWIATIAGITTPTVSFEAGRNRYIKVYDLGFRGQNTADQMCLYMDSRSSVSTGDGGLWDSDFIRVKIRNYASHSTWLRGGNDRNGTYTYNAPIQFNRWVLDVERPVGNTLGHSLIMTGQCGQNDFSGSRFDGRKVTAGIPGDSGCGIYIGREFTGGVIPGSPFNPATGNAIGAAVSGTVIGDVAPDAVWFRGVTMQQHNLMLWADRGQVILDSCYFEDNQRVIKLSGTARVMVTGCKFGNSGYDGAGTGYFIECLSGCTLEGYSNYILGTYDKDFVRSLGAIPRKIAVDNFWTGLSSDPGRKSAGITGDVTAATTTNIAGWSSVYLYGAATPVTITTLTSFRTVGTRISLKVGSNLVRFGAGTNFKVPNDNLLLRTGDAVQFVRDDIGSEWQCIGVSKAELTGTLMPSSGYYEAGEFVRNTTAPRANGAQVLGWRRATTGTAHVLGTDWIMEIRDSKHNYVSSVGTTATTIISVANTNESYGSDRHDITVVGVDTTNGTRRFTDRVVVFGGVASVIAADTFNIPAATIDPAARTYSISGSGASGVLQLAMASGTYTVRSTDKITPSGSVITSAFN